MSGGELERLGAPVPVVRRAEDMAKAAAIVRARRTMQWLSHELPTGDADEITLLIFHRLFRAPLNPDVLRRYTYVAHFRPEPKRWYVSQDPTHRMLRPMDNRDLLLFARPVAAPVLLSETAPEIPIRVRTWFLPTEAAR